MAVQRVRQARRAARSQHFLRDKSVAEELITRAGVSRRDLVLEIGAGDGAITSLLARRAGYVIAHEIDPLLAVRLRERFGERSSVLVVEGDAFAQPVPGVPYRAVSNVPFHETTRLFRLLLDDPRAALEQAALIVQWEVARKRARGGTLLGLGWAPWWELRLVRQVPAAAFRPRPSVDAGIVTVSRRPEALLPASQARAFRSFLRRSFGRGQRELGIEEWLELFRASSRKGHRGRRAEARR
ncbi:MAG: 23S ribosomal RNA methyltransferase Erm [Actinobacteria bacterium]|nr:23S ribosomal RNA methyltransferase Erm [Actinomycetota bacterium]